MKINHFMGSERVLILSYPPLKNGVRDPCPSFLRKKYVLVVFHGRGVRNSFISTLSVFLRRSSWDCFVNLLRSFFRVKNCHLSNQALNL